MNLLPLAYTMLLLILAVQLSSTALAEDIDEYIADLEDPNSTVREDAAEALFMSSVDDPQDPRMVDPLLQALNDEESGVRFWAAGALGNLRDPRSFEPLIQALSDDDLNVRINAAESLGELNDTRAVEPLIQALEEDTNPVVRSRSARALGKLKGSRSAGSDFNGGSVG